MAKGKWKQGRPNHRWTGDIEELTGMKLTSSIRATEDGDSCNHIIHSATSASDDEERIT